MLVLGLILSFALSAHAQTAGGSVDGIVLRAGTAEPIENAQVTLNTGPPTFESVLTDKEGRFSFRNVAPGRYTIRIERDGYLVPGSAPTVLVNVGSGQHVTGLTYRLIRGGTISGRILDPLGRPSALATVHALRLAYQEGRPTLLAAKTVSSNDRGEYRIFWLEPGDYYVRAEKTLPVGAARAYYPGTDDAATAAKVRVAEGVESPKIDISIQNVVSVKVSGMVTTIVAALNPARPPANAPPEDVDRAARTASQEPQLYLSSVDTAGIYDGVFAVMNALPAAQDRLAGKFEILSVRPGRYNLIAILADRSSTPVRYFMGKAPVDIGFQDVSGVNVVVVPGRDIHGRVVYGGAPALPNAQSLRVQLRPKDLVGTMAATSGLAATVGADGTFMIPNVPDLEYSVSVAPLPKDAYIADLRQGGFSIFDIGTIGVGKRSTDDFEVIVDSPGAIINGKVTASNLQLEAGAAVALVPDERRRENLSLYKRTSVSEAGVFSFTGVPPGRYKLFAWASVPTGAEFNAEFMDPFRDEAKEITVTSGNTNAVELRLISR